MTKNRLVLRGVFMVFSCVSSFAFTPDISVYVEDGDLEVPLEGAVVRTQEGKEFLCNDAGIAAVPPGEAGLNGKPRVLTVSYPGYTVYRLTIRDDNTKEYHVSLRMEALLTNEELVFTAERTVSGTQVETGRSVTIRERDLERAAEIGLLEDVMTAVRLLPGVGYTGMFNAMPSIRGGEPGDLIAALDGFYVENPYFWGGGVSIFDPRVIESAKLSHGIFSARYGRTISGLLELESQKPSDREIELGVSTSAVNLNVSCPFNSKGGIMVTGKSTYWDPFFALLRAISYAVPELEDIRAVTTAPYIRAFSLAAAYNFSQTFSMTLNGFAGFDGMGASYKNELNTGGRDNNIDMKFLWDNIQGFLIAGMRYNPAPDSVLKAAIGGGLASAYMDGAYHTSMELDETGSDFAAMMEEEYGYHPGQWNQSWKHQIKRDMSAYSAGSTVNAQARLDYDRELPHGFLFSAGGEFLYSGRDRKADFETDSDILMTDRIKELLILYGVVNSAFRDVSAYINYPFNYRLDGVRSDALTGALYALAEYRKDKFGAELGLRLDHLCFISDGLAIQSLPAVNPRLNLSYELLKNTDGIDTLLLTLGSGLFSSVTGSIQYISAKDGIDDYELKQNRSWAAVLGGNIGFPSGWGVNLEFYYKYVFDRAYSVQTREAGDLSGRTDSLMVNYYFDGEGHIFGADLLLQKFCGVWGGSGGGSNSRSGQSCLIEGWLAYSFTFARYRDPSSPRTEGSAGNDWYYPDFHRFHNLNLVLNIRPAASFNIAVRAGLASGVPRRAAGEITSYPVLTAGGPGNPGNWYFIRKYRRAQTYSDTMRDGFAVPLDVKVSFFDFIRNGKTHTEVYIALENALFFLKTKTTNTSFDAYTGQEVKGSDTASYSIPVPMLSFGFNWSC